MTPAQQPPRPVAAVGVIALCDGHVLLVRRDKEPYRGKWSFPGGSVEPGESSRAAACREVREETGVAVELVDIADVIDSMHPPGEGGPCYHYVIIDFVAVPASGPSSCPQPAGPPEPRAATDVSDARWVPLADLESYDLTPLALPVLERAVRRHAEWARERVDADATL